MTGSLKRTRETHRRDLATVRQELGYQADADPRAFWQRNRAVAARLRRRAQTRPTGVNTGPPQLDTNPVKDAQQTGPHGGGTSRRPAYLRPLGYQLPADRAGAPKGGGSDVRAEVVGLVTRRPGAGGTVADPCRYCGISGGHTADCPVIS